MRRMLVVIMIVIGLVAITACPAGKPGPASESDAETVSPKQQNESAALAASYKINSKSKNIMYTWVDETGAFNNTENVDDIPEAYRNDVLIVDLNRSPEERKSNAYAIVADLTRTDDQGNYVVRAEPRADFERAISLKRKYKLTTIDNTNLGNQPIPDNLPPVAANTDQVILYETSWCQYCKKMKKELQAMRVPFVQKDIEKDQAAAMELMAKAKQAGLGNTGVPVVDYKGTLIVGYNPKALKEAATAKGFPAVPGTPQPTTGP